MQTRKSAIALVVKSRNREAVEEEVGILADTDQITLVASITQI
jgi:hypothetical protein